MQILISKKKIPNVNIASTCVEVLQVSPVCPFDSKHRRKFTTNARTLPYNFESIQSVSIKLYVADVVVVAVSVLKLLACFFFAPTLRTLRDDDEF